MTASVGILIAGSLYWRDVPHRRRWREQFLHMDRAVAVKVPIRYGRLSRSKTCTMVCAPGTPAGQAKVVPCTNEVASLQDVVAQAAALWAAEQREEREPPLGQLHSASWGCVGLLPNPHRNLPSTLLEQWAERVSGQRPSGRDATSYDPASWALTR